MEKNNWRPPQAKYPCIACNGQSICGNYGLGKSGFENIPVISIEKAIEKIKSGPISQKIRLDALINDRYIEVSYINVKVGCVSFPRDVVIQIYKEMNKLNEIEGEF